MRYLLRPLYAIIISVFMMPLSAMAQNFPDWSAYPDQVFYAISGFYNASKFFELIADGTSGLYWLTLSAALVGAFMILFNSKNLKFGTFGPWLFLVAILLLAPIKSTLLFYPLSEKADPLNITEDQEFYGFLPQVVTMHVFTVVHRVIDKALFNCDAVGNCKIRNLIDDAIGAGELGQDPRVKIPEDGLAEEMYKAYYKMCDGSARYLAYTEDYDPAFSSYFRSLSAQIFTLGDVLDYTKYTYINNRPGAGYIGSGTSASPGRSIKSRFFQQVLSTTSHNSPPFAVLINDLPSLNQVTSGLPAEVVAQKEVDYNLGAIALSSVLGVGDSTVSDSIITIKKKLDKRNLWAGLKNWNDNGNRLAFYLAQNIDYALDNVISGRASGFSKGAENFKKNLADPRGGGRFFNFSDESTQKQVYDFPVQLGGITYLNPANGPQYTEVLNTCNDLHKSARNIILAKILLSMGMKEAQIKDYLTPDNTRSEFPNFGPPPLKNQTLQSLYDYQLSILSNIPAGTPDSTRHHLAHQQVLADLFQAALFKNNNIKNLVLTNPASNKPVSQSFDKTPEIFTFASSIVGGFADSLAGFMTNISTIFKGANAAAYLMFLYHLMNMATLAIILITPLIFIMGVLIPSYAPGVLILSVLAIAVIKIVPITFTIISAILSLISMALPEGIEQSILIHAAAGLYTGLVGITMFLMFKIGDPGSSLGALQQMDKSSKQIADASVKLTKTLAIGAAAAAVTGGASIAGGVARLGAAKAAGELAKGKATEEFQKNIVSKALETNELVQGPTRRGADGMEDTFRMRKAALDASKDKAGRDAFKSAAGFDESMSRGEKAGFLLSTSMHQTRQAALGVIGALVPGTGARLGEISNAYVESKAEVVGRAQARDKGFSGLLGSYADMKQKQEESKYDAQYAAQLGAGMQGRNTNYGDIYTNSTEKARKSAGEEQAQALANNTIWGTHTTDKGQVNKYRNADMVGKMQSASDTKEIAIRSAEIRVDNIIQRSDNKAYNTVEDYRDEEANARAQAGLRLNKRAKAKGAGSSIGAHKGRDMFGQAYEEDKALDMYRSKLIAHYEKKGLATDKAARKATHTLDSMMDEAKHLSRVTGSKVSAFTTHGAEFDTNGKSVFVNSFNNKLRTSKDLTDAMGSNVNISGETWLKNKKSEEFAEKHGDNKVIETKTSDSDKRDIIDKISKRLKY